MFNIKPALFKRAFYRKMLSIFSLSTAAFAFQACYGIETDFYYDVEISGRVTALDSGKPIVGIAVYLKDYASECFTDSAGYYTVYAPMDSAYTMIYEDIDSTLHGSFISVKMQVLNTSMESVIELDMSLAREK